MAADDDVLVKVYEQISRSDLNARVLRGFANALLCLCIVGAVTALVLGATLHRPGYDHTRAAIVALCLLASGTFVWAVYSALGNLVSNGARSLEMQAITYISIDEDGDEED